MHNYTLFKRYLTTRFMFYTVYVSCIIFAIFLSSFSIKKGSKEVYDSDDKIYEFYEGVLQNLNRQRDPDLLKKCMGFYLDNQQFDSPQGSYNKVIRLGYKIIDIDRRDIDTYTTMAWILWSKWVCWTKKPNRMPDGEGKADEAVKLLNWGKQWNEKSERFYKESADAIWPLAKYHRADLYDFVIENYRKAYLLAGTNNLLKTRIYLNLGHIYRQIGEKKPAIYWYQRALGITPNNEVAIRCLAYLGNKYKEGKTVQ